MRININFLKPESFHCRIENLFQGEFAEITKEIGPYLVEVIPYPDYKAESELMGLFSDERCNDKIQLARRVRHFYPLPLMILILYYTIFATFQ